MIRYIAITPARDEEKLLPKLIASMASQSWTPDRWIIIDDGSADTTPAILDEAARAYPWIQPHHLPRNRSRAPGGECVITQFLPHEACQEYDYILRLDADVSFDSGFIDLLLEEFKRDPKLGIASPSLWEPQGIEWVEIRQPEYHTRGPAKMYSLACFNAIGELDPDVGWDTLDEARAMLHGFHTRGFRHITARHHRPQGAESGWKARMRAGLAAYRVGYSPLFVLARAARETFTRPSPFEGALLLTGFLNGYIRRIPRCAEPELVSFIRRHQHRRLLLQESLWR
jgi:glycosyltransferase involved in cell wall biosynthesis